MKESGKITAPAKTVFVLTLALLGVGCSASIAIAQSPGTFSATGSMTTSRIFHTATLLPNGKVLIAGGSSGRPTSSAELYDPSTGVFTATGSMTLARARHTATLLPSGKVLIIGGNDERLGSAELYDPATGTFAAIGDLIAPPTDFFQRATLLASGRVLVVHRLFPDPRFRLGVTEIHEDPATGTFSAVEKASITTSFGVQAEVILLPDGRVLIASCCNQSLLYDPGSGVLSFAGSALRVGEQYTATLLTNGKVLLAGGDFELYPQGSADADFYDPTTGTFTATGDMTTRRFAHTAILLPDGTVLIAGNSTDVSFGLATAELYDPITGRFTATADMTTARAYQTATLLPDGRVLIAGGLNYNRSAPTSSAELYNPPLLGPVPILSLDSTNYCTGATWSLRAGNAVPKASIRLLGTTNGKFWEVSEWRKTDANGSIIVEGTFPNGTEGTYTLRKEIGGVLSNAVPFTVSNCGS